MAPQVGSAVEPQLLCMFPSSPVQYTWGSNHLFVYSNSYTCSFAKHKNGLDRPEDIKSEHIALLVGCFELLNMHSFLIKGLSF